MVMVVRIAVGWDVKLVDVECVEADIALKANVEFEGAASEMVADTVSGLCWIGGTLVVKA